MHPVGVSGLVGSLILKPRKSAYQEDRSDLTKLLTFIGGAMLWVGWFGLNAGSAMSAGTSPNRYFSLSCLRSDVQCSIHTYGCMCTSYTSNQIPGTSAAMAMLVTHIAASTCSFFWMLIEYAHKRQFTLVGAVSGAVTGLVVITPAAGFVDQTGAFAMGLIGALCCYPAVVAKNKFGLDQKALRDDYPDAFGVHAIGGMVGTFWTGLFANPEINLLATGAFYFNDKLLGWQIVGIIFVVLWSAVLTAIIMLALKFTIGIDVPDEEPEADSAEIAEVPKAPVAYFMPGPSLTLNTPPPPALMMPMFTMPVQQSMPMQQSHMNYVNPYNPVMGQPRPFLGSI